MSQIGAIFYIAWGLLHLYAAFQVYKLGKRQLAGIVQGRIYQSVWNLAAVAVAVIAVAVVYNWFHHPRGVLAQSRLDQRHRRGFHPLRRGTSLSAVVAGALGPGALAPGGAVQHAGTVGDTCLTRPEGYKVWIPPQRGRGQQS